MFLLFYVLFLLFVVFFLSPICVNFVLWHLTHHVVAWGWAFLMSLVIGGLTIPVAIIIKILVLVHILQ